jgi:hypothetical protein
LRTDLWPRAALEETLNLGANVNNQQSESLDADGTDHSLTHKQAAYEELIIPCGEFGVLFVSAVLVVVVLLGGFSTLPAENNKSVSGGIAAFLSNGVVWPLSRRMRDCADPKGHWQYTHQKNAARRCIDIITTMRSHASGSANW